MRWTRWLVLLLCLPVLASVRPTAAVQPARMGEVVTSPAWLLTVRSVERQSTPLVANDESTRPKGQFAIFTVDLANRLDHALEPDAADFTLHSGTGAIAINQASTPVARQFALVRESKPFGDEIEAGSTITTLLIFDIPANAFPLTLSFVPGHRNVKIDECSCSLPAPGGRT